MDTPNAFDILKLENQLCFPLYAASREVTKKYTAHLDELGLTYTQYVTMMVLWEKKSLNVKELGECLYLDSGTLTPLLKTMEQKGLITRERSTQDERVLIVSVTKKGMALRERAVSIPGKVAACVNLTDEEATELHRLLHKILGDISD
ncbi:MAG: MarR family transcriptional regulator [Eggerthellaceae bacterium]|nr:MarR family transcriptional regulator [Eggerthellaceae bacterium]